MTNDKQLDWLAFCYAAGELSAAEAEAFELRLAEEQPAREALARAVELTQVAAAAEAQPTVVLSSSRSHSTWKTRVAWMAVGGLASLLAAFLFTGKLHFRLPWQSSKQVQLAAAWSETRTQFKSNAELGLWTAEPPRADEGDDLLAATASPMDEVSDETPSWLNAALGIVPDSDNDSSTSDTSSGD